MKIERRLLLRLRRLRELTLLLLLLLLHGATLQRVFIRGRLDDQLLHSTCNTKQWKKAAVELPSLTVAHCVCVCVPYLAVWSHDKSEWPFSPLPRC